MISLKKSFIYKDLCYLMILWSVKLPDDIVIKAGDLVEKGQLIGHVGTTGYSTGCHLHFQAMVKNQSINPDVLYTLEWLH